MIKVKRALSLLLCLFIFPLLFSQVVIAEDLDLENCKGLLVKNAGLFAETMRKGKMPEDAILKGKHQDAEDCIAKYPDLQNFAFENVYQTTLDHADKLMEPVELQIDQWSKDNPAPIDPCRSILENNSDIYLRITHEVNKTVNSFEDFQRWITSINEKAVKEIPELKTCHDAHPNRVTENIEYHKKYREFSEPLLQEMNHKIKQESVPLD